MLLLHQVDNPTDQLLHSLSANRTTALVRHSLCFASQCAIVQFGAPVTPDGRYFVVRGRLWRIANPDVDEAERSNLTKRLMTARRAVRDAKANEDPDAEAAARRAVDEAKRALGERGPVWWKDGALVSTGTWRRTRPMPTGTRR